MSRTTLTQATDAATQALDRFQALEQERLAAEGEEAYTRFQQVAHDHEVSREVDAAFSRLLGQEKEQPYVYHLPHDPAHSPDYT